MSLYKIHINLPEINAVGLEIDRLQFFGESLEGIATSFTLDCAETYESSAKSETHPPARSISWYTDQKPPPVADILALLKRGVETSGLDGLVLSAGMIEISEMEEENWLEKSYESFPPFSVGPFFIHGDHYNPETDGDAPDGSMALEINAATAFGSGEHGTTKGCLLAMIDLKNQGVCPWNVLDIGTGSGILAIAAWKLWHTPILATDIDPESIRVTRKHMEINGVAEKASAVSCAVGAGFQAGAIHDKSPYELITANILAGPLMEMADGLAGTMDSNSYIILSGILNRRETEVRATFEGAGLTFKRRYGLDGWTTLLMHKS